MQDAVWDKYTDEAILVEYYANVFAKSKEERQKFETSLAAEGDSMDDFATWADSQIAKNQEEMADKAKKLEDSVSFKPETIGE